MNRKERRALIAMGRKGVERGRYGWEHYISPIGDQLFDQPLSESEIALSEKIAAWRDGQGGEWFHGGIRGRAVGDYLLPATETGQDPRNNGDLFLWRKNFVYITHSITDAAIYAHKCSGVVYRVRPLGRLGVDPTALRRLRLANMASKTSKIRQFDIFEKASEFVCERAEVLEVIEC